jgi:hypothetical protein
MSGSTRPERDKKFGPAWTTARQTSVFSRDMSVVPTLFLHGCSIGSLALQGHLKSGREVLSYLSSGKYILNLRIKLLSATGRPWCLPPCLPPSLPVRARQEWYTFQFTFLFLLQAKESLVFRTLWLLTMCSDPYLPVLWGKGAEKSNCNCCSGSFEVQHALWQQRCQT